MKIQNVPKGKLKLVFEGGEYKVKDLATGKIHTGFDSKAEAEDFIDIYTDADLRDKKMNASFQNGRMKAEKEINQKIGNAMSPSDAVVYKQGIWTVLQQGKNKFVVARNGFQYGDNNPVSSLESAKAALIGYSK